ncbi:hypothetical protein MLD38_033015 [Melastoma candidum]|uniref:Uncharacterized protein n=1 Tax=Melastoma candidum TaxID=119954 RepID=A0ACB9M601_9MYRT|nr:hypothetical protein MLD38_033015 [Melastoma candidum]
MSDGDVREAAAPEGNGDRKLQRYDSLDVESGNVLHRHGSGVKQAATWSVVLHLAFQSIGIVYGDIGTSPLYVMKSVFSGGISNTEDVTAVLSLILYTLTLLPLVKYVLIVLHANDNGEGGTFALYSLVCRYVKVGLIPSQQAEDRQVSNYQLQLPDDIPEKRAGWLKSVFENSNYAKYILLFLTMLGTSMVIGDGILTPSISVVSAVEGIAVATPAMTRDVIVWISVAILVLLFLSQRFGTDKVGNTFAPIICIWFSMNTGIGIYNFFKYDPAVIKALNPLCIIQYFQRNGKDAWISLGGVVLVITGAEAMFADLGHFSVKSIQISMTTLVYPSLVITYTGQASFLRKHPELASDTFYKSIPGAVYWPMFVVAVLAAAIASQAMISGTFSIIQQSLALGCFPRVKVVHTSAKFEGQVYVPGINYLLMVACVAVTVGFRTTEKIGNAYGIAVVFVMVLTSLFLGLIMIMVWKTNLLLVILYAVTIGLIELVYLSSVLYKFDQGGYLPLAFAAIVMMIMYVWNYVYCKKYYYELDHKITPERLKEIISDPNLRRMPKLALFYSELVQGIPPIFEQYLSNVPALNNVLVFISFKSLPISKVPQEERFLFRRIASDDANVYRCVVRYGYSDVHGSSGRGESFEVTLVEGLKGYIRSNTAGGDEEGRGKRDVEAIEGAWDAGVVHLVGESDVAAGKGSGIRKRITIDYGYNFLKRNLKQSSNEVFDIPHEKLLKVGMTYLL